MGTLPASVPVSGSDWFMLAMDRARRARVGHGNLCHLVIRLDVHVGARALQAAVDALPLAGWLAALRVERSSPVALPRWSTGARARSLPVRAHVISAWDGQPEALFADVLDASHEAPVTLDLLEGPDGTSAVVLSWHHALMDARGAELLARMLAGGLAADEVIPWVPPRGAEGGTLVDRLMRAKDARDFVFRTSFRPLATLGRTGKGRPRLHHRETVIAGDDLRRFEVALRASGAGFLRSAFVLAAVARAVHAVLVARGQGDRELLVPVPQDQRPRGQLGPVLSNQLGILFYRLAPGDLVDVRGAVRALGDQLKAMLRDGVPDAFGELLSLCRVLPLDLFLPLVLAPTFGRVATFGFSDAGDGLGQLTSFLGHPVRSAVHVPANIEPPGFTVVVSRAKDRLVVSTAWMEGALRSGEWERYEASLRADLLEGSPT